MHYGNQKKWIFAKFKEKIKQIISSSNFIFKLDDDIINEEDESFFTISNIEKDKKIYIVSHHTSKIPILGSIEKERFGDIKIYSYPEIDLNEIEKVNLSNTKNILFIGKSGDGKTTFINALINVLLDIKPRMK